MPERTPEQIQRIFDKSDQKITELRVQGGSLSGKKVGIIRAFQLGIRLGRGDEGVIPSFVLPSGEQVYFGNEEEDREIINRLEDKLGIPKTNDREDSGQARMTNQI